MHSVQVSFPINSAITATSPSQQSPLRVPTLPSAPWQVSTDSLPLLSSPQEASFPGSPHHRVGTAPVKTTDDSCASEAAGQARAFMPLEGTAGAVLGGSHPLPLEDTSPDVKDSRPPLLLHPRNCPAPFSWLPRPSSCTQSASRTSQCPGTQNALTSVFSQTSPLHSKHLHPTWLPAALWSFTRAAGLTPTRPYFNNLHRPPSRPGAETSGR